MADNPDDLSKSPGLLWGDRSGRVEYSGPLDRTTGLCVSVVCVCVCVCVCAEENRGYGVLLYFCVYRLTQRFILL